jgi:UDP-galactopyranose mutase
MGSNLILNENVRSVDLKERSIVLSDGAKISGDVLISSIPLEELCNYSCGELLYAGRDFIVFVLPCKQVFPGDIRFCHYTGNEPYTRIVEYKKLTFHKANDTLLVLEIPSKANKLYPYMMKKYIETSKRYSDSLPDNVFSIGRLGTYKYSTIEQTISQCFSLFKSLTGKSIGGMENEFYNLGDISLLKERKTLSGEANVGK